MHGVGRLDFSIGWMFLPVAPRYAHDSGQVSEIQERTVPSARHGMVIRFRGVDWNCCWRGACLLGMPIRTSPCCFRRSSLFRSIWSNGRTTGCGINMTAIAFVFRAAFIAWDPGDVDLSASTRRPVPQDGGIRAVG